MFTMALSFVAVGLLFTALALPLIGRRVPPNRLYGLRVPATFADERVWYEANARSGYDLLELGVLLILLALFLPALRLGPDVYALTWSAVAVLGAIYIGVAGWRRAQSLLQQRGSSEGSGGA